MALQMETYLTGKIGNIVYFKRNGTYIARAMPVSVKVAAETKLRAGNFGLASACGKSLRQQLVAVLPDAKDRNMQLRFSGAIAKWPGNEPAANLQPTDAVPYVCGFQFNTATGIAERWHLPLTVQQQVANMLTLQIPAFTPKLAITAPAHTISITCTITVAGSLLQTAMATGNYTTILEIPYNNIAIPAQVINLPVALPPGALVVTAMSLQYKLAGGAYCRVPAFLPASVIDARYC